MKAWRRREAAGKRITTKRGKCAVLQKSPKSISIVSRTRAWKSSFPFIPALDGLGTDAPLAWGEFFESGACASGAGDPPGFGVVDLGTTRNREKINRVINSQPFKRHRDLRERKVYPNLPRRKQARDCAQPRARVKGGGRTESSLAALPLCLLELRAADRFEI